MRRLVWIVDAGEVFYLSLAGEAVHTLHVAFFADCKRRINEDFHEAIRANHRAAFITGGTIRADGSADHSATVAGDLRCNETDPPDVGVAVFLREAKSLREMRAHDVAVEHRHLTPVFEQSCRQDLSSR